MKRLMIVAFAAAMTATCAKAAEQIGLSVLHFRPLDAELNKFLTPIQRKSINAAPMKITPEERSILDSATLTMLKTEEFFAKMRARKEQMLKDEENGTDQK